MEDIKPKKKKRKDLTNLDRIERYIKAFNKNTRTEWERLEDKKGMTYKEFWEMWRQKTIQEYKNQLTALDIAQPPAVIKIKNKKTSNYIKEK